MQEHTFTVDGHKVNASVCGGALFLSIEGCTDAVSSNPDAAAQVRLDWYYDHPTLYVWADKDEEEPTDEISLGRALIDRAD